MSDMRLATNPVLTGSAGIAELAIFHPVDTTAKRLMSNQGKITSAAQLNSVVFKGKAEAPIGTRFFSLFPGLGYAAAYKVRYDRKAGRKESY